jgi:hypothetical protein
MLSWPPRANENYLLRNCLFWSTLIEQEIQRIMLNDLGLMRVEMRMELWIVPKVLD